MRNLYPADKSVTVLSVTSYPQSNGIDVLYGSVEPDNSRQSTIAHCKAIPGWVVVTETHATIEPVKKAEAIRRAVRYITTGVEVHKETP